MSDFVTTTVEDSMFWEKAKTLLGALPAQLAAIQSLLTVVAVEVVPLLPDEVALRAGAWVTIALGWVALAIRYVSRVTPVPADGQGLVVPAGKVVMTSVAPVGVTVGIGARGTSTITTTNPQDDAA